MRIPENLKLSIGNLFEQFGSTNSIGLAFVINGGLAAIGLVVFIGLDGPARWLGLAWAIINLGGILQWVVNQ